RARDREGYHRGPRNSDLGRKPARSGYHVPLHAAPCPRPRRVKKARSWGEGPRIVLRASLDRSASAVPDEAAPFARNGGHRGIRNDVERHFGALTVTLT